MRLLLTVHIKFGLKNSLTLDLQQTHFVVGFLLT